MTRESSFLPNAYQTPNAYVDGYLHLLTGEEWKVLTYAIRRIFGFQKRRDRISISQFANGIEDKDGNKLDHGCGLSVDTICRTVGNLVRFGFLVQTAKNDPKDNYGAEYELQLDDAKVDINALISRGQQKKETNRRRIQKAVRVLFASRQQLPLLSDRTLPPIVGQNAPSIVGQNAPPIVGQKHNKQGNTGKTESIKPTLEEIEEMGIPELLRLPEMRLFKKVTKRIPGQPQWTIIVEFIREHNPTEEDMKKCWKAWSKQNYRPGNLGWMDWLIDGIPDFKKNGANYGNTSRTSRGATQGNSAGNGRGDQAGKATDREGAGNGLSPESQIVANRINARRREKRRQRELSSV